jgi:flagellar biosynthesis component FlhA
MSIFERLLLGSTNWLERVGCCLSLIQKAGAHRNVRFRGAPPAAESLEKPEAMISAIRLKSDLQRLIVKQAERGGAGAFSLPTDPNERKELLQRIREERARRQERKLELVMKYRSKAGRTT